MFQPEDNVSYELKEREVGLPSGKHRLLLTLGSIASFLLAVFLLIMLSILTPVIFGYGYREYGGVFEDNLLSVIILFKFVMIGSCFFVSGFYQWCARYNNFATINLAIVCIVAVIQAGFGAFMVIQAITANGSAFDESTINNPANDYYYACYVNDYCAPKTGAFEPKVSVDALRVPTTFWLALVGVGLQILVTILGAFVTYYQSAEGKNMLAGNGFLGLLELKNPIYSNIGDLTPTSGYCMTDSPLKSRAGRVAISDLGE